MPRKKRQMGRPSTRTLPPRIDATPEEVARAVLNAGRSKGPVQDRKKILLSGLQAPGGLP